jgi:hypothetical protein
MVRKWSTVPISLSYTTPFHSQHGSQLGLSGPGARTHAAPVLVPLNSNSALVTLVERLNRIWTRPRQVERDQVRNQGEWGVMVWGVTGHPQPVLNFEPAE